MKIKFKFLFLAFSTIVFFSSCGSDCELTTLEEVIVGEWKLSLGDNNGEIEFLKGGALSDPDDVLLGGEIGGVKLDQKTYTIINENTFSVRAEGGSNFLETEFDVESFDCDKITLNIIGLNFDMKRK
ncbi:MAG: hypothetical protein V3V14_11290 [Saprospiraceae bacterium]